MRRPTLGVFAFVATTMFLVGSNDALAGDKGGGPPNDDCDEAIAIFDGATPFSTIDATDSGPDLPAECDEGFGLALVQDIWFSYEATCTGPVTVSTCDTADYDTRLAAYLDCAGTFVACNDDGDGCSGFTSIMTFDASAGTTYLLRVGGFGTAGSGTITIGCAGTECPAKCLGDIDGSGEVDGADLGLLLGAWGSDDVCANLSEDGTVDGNDLGLLLGAWGPCDDGIGCPGEGDCCEANGTPACDDQLCCVAVCSADAFCCETEWDDLCAEQAGDICDICAPVDPCPGDGDCCLANGTPGCNDETCCDAVCAVDALCCDIDWDAGCVELAIELCEVCSVGDCDGEGDCCEANGTPSCDDAECCAAVCFDDPFCCDFTWDGLCADLAGQLCDGCGGGGDPCPGEGDCCVDNGTPGCDDVACCEAVCAADAFCCEVEWDALCGESAADLCKGCDVVTGCPGEGDCCIFNGTPGCDDLECCDLVCAADAFCCEVAWDDACAALAADLCDGCSGEACPGEGDCCDAGGNGTPGCDDLACCEAVCAIDPFCCDTAWDGICAEEAAELCAACGVICGGAGSGDCCVPHESIGCDDAACCDAVCAIDEFCCEVEWDSICADEASTECDICTPGA